MSNRSKKRVNKYSGSSRELGFEKLEPKNLLAGIMLQGGNLVLDGSAGNDFARVVLVNSTTVRASMTGFDSQTFSTSQFDEIRFFGRAGNDSFANNTNIDSRAYGHGGRDRMMGGSGSDHFEGGDAMDVLMGGKGNDTLHGNGGNDTVRGGDGNDRVYGESGADKVYGDRGHDRVAGNSGNDQLFGGQDADRIWGGDDADRIMGDGGSDFIYGGAGNDVIDGGWGNDRLFGEAGNDKLDGDRGYDQLVGGDNNDTAVYSRRFANYNFTANGAVVVISDSVAQETIASTEFFQFSDGLRVNNNPNTGGGSGGNSGGNGGNSGGNNGGNSGNNGGSTTGFNDAETRSRTLLNQFRTSNGRQAVSTASDLSTYAENWSRQMGRTGFRHSEAADRNALVTGSRTAIAENIAFVTNVGQSLQEVAEYFHDAWRASSTHRVNMLNGTYTEVGIGIVLGADNRWYGTHVFAG